MKTIREVAESIGVSKTSVYNLIQRHKIKTSKQNGITCVDEVGEKLIAGYYSTERQETVNDIASEGQKNDNSQSNFQDSQLEGYRHFIKTLEGELKEKNETIKGLIQALTAEKINESRRLSIQENQQSQNDAFEPSQKSGIFRKFFRKK